MLKLREMFTDLDRKILEGLQILAEEGSNCIRCAVGCCVVTRDGSIISVGINRMIVPPGVRSCRSGNFCEGHTLAPGLDKCRAIHAEQEAIAGCIFPDRIHSVYVTKPPCHSCVKLLLATSCHYIYFTGDPTSDFPQELWESAGRHWIKVD